MLQGVYERIRQSEFRPGSDHVTQVMKVQQTIVSKCPNLAVPYRRLVCYCRLYEVTDPNKKDRPGKSYQKSIALFNSLSSYTSGYSALLEMEKDPPLLASRILLITLDESSLFQANTKEKCSCSTTSWSSPRSTTDARTASPTPSAAVTPWRG